MRHFEPSETVRPQTPPVRNITSFTPALRCMDKLLATYGLGDQGIGGALLTGEGVLDKTGKNIGGDNLDVLMVTISKMATHSGAYKFVRYNPRKLSLEELERLRLFHGGDMSKITWPRYDLSGSITQLDENVDARSLSVSVALFGGDIGASKDIRATVVSVDMNLSDAITGQVLNGMHASNTMAIKRQGKALDGGGAIQKVGLYFTVSLDQNEGIYAALRALIELSTIEVLGKLARIPYWQCLQIDATNPEVFAMTRDWFAELAPEQRVRFTQRVLKQQGYYDGSLSGAMDQATQAAVARYQAAADLIPSGRIDLDLYRRLLSTEAAPRQPATLPRPEPVAPTAAPLALTLTTPRGTTPIYAARESLTLTAQVSQEATLLCFYRDAQQRISRLYPNRFQPQARVVANQEVAVPGTAPFALRLETPGSTEEVRCLATTDDITPRLPAQLTSDLTPLSVARLEELEELLRPLAPAGLVQALLQVQVGKAGTP
jgi:hypothetical protein